MNNLNNEQDLAALRFKSAARDLEHIVRHIAARYIVQQVPLTWRLLHAIEAEALADLGFASRHDPFMLGLFQRPGDFQFPETDDAVDLSRSNALPAVFAFAVAAYDDAEKATVGAAKRRIADREHGAGRAWGG